MRPSSKTAILDAARRVAERSGIGSLTLEAAAQEAGLTKPGLMYHFATKEQMRVAVAEFITAGWEAEMLAALGKPFADATAAERVGAYCHVVTEMSTGKGDLAIFVDSVHEEALIAPWCELLRRWLSGTVPVTVASSAGAVDLIVARLAADGLWMADASQTSGLDKAARDAVIARIQQLATGGDEAR